MTEWKIAPSNKEAEEAVLSVPFTALGTSGGDEFRIAWNQG